jgi:hypothetical protein
MSAAITDPKGKDYPVEKIKTIILSDFSDYTFIDVQMNDLRAGTYSGILVFKITPTLPSPTSSNQILDASIKITINVTQGIEVEKATDIVTTEITNRISGFEEENFLNVKYRLKKDLPVPVIESYQMILRGKINSQTITEQHLAIDVGKSITEDMKIKLTTDNFPADTYTGSLHVNVKDFANGPIRFENVIVKVKDPELIAFAFLLIGIVAGGLLRLYNTQTVAFNKLYRQIQELIIRAKERSDLVSRLNEQERRLNVTNPNMIEIQKAVDNIDLELAISLKIKSVADGSRRQVLEKRVIDNKVAILTMLNEPELKPIITDKESEYINLKYVIEKSSPLGDGLRNFMAYITGQNMNLARKKYLVPLLQLGLLVLACLYGFDLNYWNNPHFGDNRFHDYLNIFIWGTGSTAILKTVFGIGQ